MVLLLSLLVHCWVLLLPLGRVFVFGPGFVMLFIVSSFFLVLMPPCLGKASLPLYFICILPVCVLLALMYLIVQNGWSVIVAFPGLEVIKLFSCSSQLSTKFILLINVKMPTIISTINTTSELFKAGNFFTFR